MSSVDGNHIIFDEKIGRPILVDKDGNRVNKYEEITKYQDFYIAKKCGKFGIVDENDNKLGLIDFIYDNIYLPNEGMIMVKKDGKYGFLSELFIEAIPCVYKRAKDFQNGLAKVCYDDNKTIFIDYQNKRKLSLPYSFDNVSDIIGGLIEIEVDSYGSKFVTNDGEDFQNGQIYEEVTSDGKFFYGNIGDNRYKIRKSGIVYYGLAHYDDDDRPDTYDDWLRRN